jgi:hypothetical protein
MAESINNSQREYNDLLSMSQSMLGKISNAMGELDSLSDKRNKKLSQEISFTKQYILAPAP